MSFSRTVLIAALLLGPLGRAEPPSAPREARSSPLETRTVRFEGASFHVVTVELGRVSLRLIRQDDEGQPLKSFEALEAWLTRRGERLLAATNAGIFEPGEVPTGLFIQDGKELAPLNLREGRGNFYWKPNGVFLIGPGGAQIVEASRYRGDGKVRQATQSGPLLLLAGKVHSGFASSKGTATRSGVGVDARNSQRVHLVLSSEPVRLETFAELFRSELGCTDALYLDGNVSRLYPPALQGGDSDTHGTFSGFLAVIEKK
jgi:uncharacterized protein YigE (DUF2233 family)